MKKMLSVVASIFMLLVIMVGFKLTANAATSGDFEYEVLADGTVGIMECKSTSKNIVVPSTINGKQVTSIGSGAFMDCENLEKLTLPDGLNNIGTYGFDETPLYKNSKTWENGALYISNYLIATNPKLIKESYTVKEGTRCIGESAFGECESLKEIIIPDSVIGISDFAFSGCFNLKNIKVSKNITKIGEAVFDETKFYNTNVNWKNGVLYLDNYLIKADDRKVKGDYIVKEGTKCIANSAFLECVKLTGITIPDSVESIEVAALAGCTKLTKVKLPKNIKYIPMSMFFSCSSLEKITIPSEVKGIGAMAFWGCEGLKEVVDPDNVTEIFEMAFVGCSNLKTITIPKNVKTIKDSAFAQCPKLTRINYGGTKSEWKQIKVEEGNEQLTKATVYCKGSTIAPVVLKSTTVKKVTPTSNSVKVSWSKISGVTGYQVQIATDSKFSKNKKTYTLKETSKTIKNLKSNQKYYVHVRTYKGSDYSKWSKTQTVTTKLKSTTFKTFSKTKNSVSMTWNKISGVTGYQIQLATDKSFKKSVKSVKITKSTTTKTTISKLKSAKKYYVHIRTYKGKKYSDWSKTYSITTR